MRQFVPQIVNESYDSIEALHDAYNNESITQHRFSQMKFEDDGSLSVGDNNLAMTFSSMHTFNDMFKFPFVKVLEATKDPSYVADGMNRLLRSKRQTQVNLRVLDNKVTGFHVQYERVMPETCKVLDMIILDTSLEAKVQVKDHSVFRLKCLSNEVSVKGDKYLHGTYVALDHPIGSVSHGTHLQRTICTNSSIISRGVSVRAFKHLESTTREFQKLLPMTQIKNPTSLWDMITDSKTQLLTEKMFNNAFSLVKESTSTSSARGYFHPTYMDLRKDKDVPLIYGTKFDLFDFMTSRNKKYNNPALRMTLEEVSGTFLVS